MTITPNVFAAYLKCTTKCWLRAVSENPTGNAYAEWIQDKVKISALAGKMRKRLEKIAALLSSPEPPAHAQHSSGRSRR